MARRPWVLAALLSPALLAAPGRADDSRYETTVQPFLASKCYACHNARMKTADLNLEAFKTREAMLADADTWQKVMVKLRTGQMPPPPFPRPDPAQVQAILDWVSSEFDRAEQAAPPDPGRVTARRLNRAEYDNTVRDLLGVSLRPAQDFPQDDAGYGFDNNGDVLSLSPALMERYMTAAERLTQAALFGPPPLKPTLVRLQPARGKVEASPTVPPAYDETGLSLPNALHARHVFPATGEYAFHVVLGGTRPRGSEPVQVALYVDGVRIGLQSFDAEGTASFTSDRPDFSGKVVEFKTRLEPGAHWVAASIVGLYDGLPASYGGPHPSTRTPAPLEFKPRPDATPEQIEAGRKRFEETLKEVAPANEARVSGLEIVGPYGTPPGPSRQSLQLVYTCGHLDGHHGPACARQILTRMARRAYRRPVTDKDVDPLVALAAQARRDGASFEEGLRLALEAILVSPDFLFRLEEDHPATATERFHPINPHELAARLSYFLWASMPDDALSAAADDGTLRQPAVLEAQVRRLLKDPKASALVEAFAGQWLQFRALESKAPDRERFPQFEDNLRLSMMRETELFFASVVREDRSIVDFLDAPYTFLNERLARHYGIPGVTGSEFRKVDLTDTPRRGVLTQGSVLTVSSYATRTSPVLRGKWILDNVLAAPPPDPPPGTPRLDEATVGANESLRRQMEAHRSNVVCASCHSRMDPLGFALENFDATGAWRAQDGKFPIDASGQLPDGRTFAGPSELTRLLAGDRDAFTECLTEKLLTFALGRGLERYDRRTVKAIAGAVAKQDYRFSALVLEIVNSLPFQMRRATAGES